ncbi:MAG: DUF6159 family protein [Candidatus Sulfobium sp.]|jgi:Family of unknown function (DUF6159)
MGKFSSTWSLMGASWQVLKKDKEILVFPLISGVCCLVVLASFAIPLIASGSWQPPGGDASTGAHIVYYATLFLFYFCNYFVIVFFNAAIVACARVRMEGGNPTVSDGLRAAASLLPLIAGWALISATVGLILRVIEDRSERLGQLVAGLLGVAWTVASFLVVPVLVVEKKGPFTALKESTVLLKKTWGQQLIGNFSFGLVFFLLGIPAIVFIVLGFATGSGAGTIVGVVLATVYLIGLALIQSALQAIFQAALYLYARSGQVAPGFEPEILANAMVRK